MTKANHGSSRRVVRIEVYLDSETTPSQVLTSPPFHLDLDTSELPDGKHTLRLVQVYGDGASVERSVPFVVRNRPPLEISGIEPGAVVAGRLGIDIADTEARPVYADPVAPPPPRVAPGPPAWLYVAAASVLFGGVWLFFVLVPTYSIFAERQTGATQVVDVDAAVMASGQALYDASCAICHQADGSGLGAAIPGLARNADLADTTATLEMIRYGSDLKQGFPTLDAAELASVATYIRNSWGNAHGEVDVAEAAAIIAADDSATDEPAATTEPEPSEPTAAEPEPTEPAAAEPEPVEPTAAAEAGEGVGDGAGVRYVSSSQTQLTAADGAPLGVVMLGTELAVSGASDDASEVTVRGWSMGEGPSAVFYGSAQRIPLASLTDEGQEAREVVETVTDAFGTEWHEVSLSGIVATEDLTGDLDALWLAGEELASSACGACHAVYTPDQFTVNQWPGTIRSYVPSYVSLTPDEIELLTKYNQYHARDME